MESRIDVPVLAAGELAGRTAEFSAAVIEARRILARFAAKHGWEREAAVRTFDSVEVHGSQAGLWRRLVEVLGLPADAAIPTDGLAGALEKRILLVISPEEYRRIRPEYVAREDDWTRLLAHEMAHRLHIEVLCGDEEAMGPLWFFEGFALLAAGQELGDAAFASPAQALEAARGARGRGAYAVYAAALRYLAGLVPLRELVRGARDPGFEAWVASLGAGSRP